ncbi:glycosyltransferase [Evansella tamaricis]|uniref:Glycosyltransferase n=1 Tax=Evansella tamaricis TaxID=2069301 RepID=A0ABS6JJF3_9BACI|nr:glycosyltransferase [Evansella tamaricis]MBU9713334.1 glycosyltransferase [Evansella tamaricis]
MGDQLDISLCLITKNEEDVLADCLQSVESIVREIIIVDTGSTDATISIGEKFNSTILHFPWNENFSDARNKGLQKASCEWILVLDADERLVIPEGMDIQKLLYDKRMYGYYVNLYNYITLVPVEEYVVDSACRLFRNHPKIRFQGSIHEEVSRCIKENFSEEAIQFTNIRINHLGYTSKKISQKEKGKRNKRIILKGLAMDPADTYLQYSLATEYFQERKFYLAERLYLPLLYNKKTEGYHSDIVYKCANCMKELGRIEKALHMVTLGVKEYPQFTDLAEFHAVLLYELDEYEQAIEVLQNIGRDEVHSFYYSTSSGSGTYKTNYLLGINLQRLCKWQEALSYFEKALTQNPNYIPAIVRWSQLSLSIVKDQDEWFRRYYSLFKHVNIKVVETVLLQIVNERKPELGFRVIRENLSKRKLAGYKYLFRAQKKKFNINFHLLLDGGNETTETLLLFQCIISKRMKENPNGFISSLVKHDKVYIHLKRFTSNNVPLRLPEIVYKRLVRSSILLREWEFLEQLYGMNIKKYIPYDLFPSFQSCPKEVRDMMFPKFSKEMDEKLPYIHTIFSSWAAVKDGDFGSFRELLSSALNSYPNRKEAKILLENKSSSNLKKNFFDIGCRILP